MNDSNCQWNKRYKLVCIDQFNRNQQAVNKMLRTSYTWYDLETLCKMTHLKKRNARRIYISMLKIILVLSILWFVMILFFSLDMNSFTCVRPLKKLSPDLVHRWSIIYLFLNWRTNHASCTESVNTPNQSHLKFILSVHLRGEEDIEAGLYLDGSVVVYCNTITKS